MHLHHPLGFLDMARDHIWRVPGPQMHILPNQWWGVLPFFLLRNGRNCIRKCTFCARMVEGEMARVHPFVCRAKMHTIPQNLAPIILSYRMHFCAASMVVPFHPPPLRRLIRLGGPELGKNAWKLTVYDPIMQYITN